MIRINIIWRARLIWLIVLMIFIALSTKLFTLSTKERTFLVNQGEKRSSRINIEHASRGKILDRNKVILAQSFPSAKVWFFAKDYNKYLAAQAKIQQALHLNHKDITKQYKKHSRIITLKTNVSPKELEWLKNQRPNFLNYEQFDKRYYFLQNASGPILGMVNKKGQGQEGIERAYDSILQSKEGKLYVEKNRKGSVVKVNKVLSNSEESFGITLTLDSDLQNIAYNCLAAGVKKYGAESGSVIIIKPKSGEIYAMANYPSFNPNNTKSINFNSVRNRAISDLFEPGSTMKPFTLAAVLATDTYKITDKIDTGNGTLKVFGHKVEDEFHQHGILSMVDILKKSSNVAITKMALALAPKVLPGFLKSFGFTKYSLYLPGEEPGLINHKAWQHGIEQATLAFGYGISVNALQLAHAYAILANDGVDAGLYLNKSHKTQARRVIQSKVAQDIRKLLVHVTDYGGTAHAAKVKGVEVAGKTGTSRIASAGVYRKSYIASFVGMMPAQKPEWVVLVVVKKPNLRYYFGGKSAAPIFANIAKSIQELKLLHEHTQLPRYL